MRRIPDWFGLSTGQPPCFENQVGNFDMKNFARMAVLAAAATAVAAPASAQVAADPVARARVNVVKPLSLAAEQDLHFGNVIVWDNGTVDINRLTGAITCPATLECDPSGTVAQ